MSNTPKAIPVKMIRDNLDNLPDHPLPAGYTLRWFQPGDERHWTAIWKESEKFLEITPGLFDGEFGKGREQLPQRMLFFFDAQGQAVGTTTAWYDDNYHGQRVGRVHWVAIVPSQQGRGLAKPLMSVCCRRLYDLGHRVGVLGTHNTRIPAINLYREFGFVPDIRNEADLTLWRDLAPQLKLPLPELKIR